MRRGKQVKNKKKSIHSEEKGKDHKNVFGGHVDKLVNTSWRNVGYQRMKVSFYGNDLKNIHILWKIADLNTWI